MITESLVSYEVRARADASHVGVGEAVLALLRIAPGQSAAALADRLNKTSRTIDRHLADLQSAGRPRHEGPPKTGRWVVVDR